MKDVRAGHRSVLCPSRPARPSAGSAISYGLFGLGTFGLAAAFAMKSRPPRA